MRSVSARAMRLSCSGELRLAEIDLSGETQLAATAASSASASSHSICRGTWRCAQGSAPNSPGTPGKPSGRWRNCGATIVGAVVVIVTVGVAAVALLGVTELGVTAHVACAIVAGSAQLKFTVWLNPPCDATKSVNVAVPPAATVAETWFVESAKSSPVPESATMCGLPGELSVITSAPLRVPPAVGLKVTIGAQLPPGTITPQGFDATAKSPVAVTLVTVTDFVVLPFAM